MLGVDVGCYCITVSICYIITIFTLINSISKHDDVDIYTDNTTKIVASTVVVAVVLIAVIAVFQFIR